MEDSPSSLITGGKKLENRQQENRTEPGNKIQARALRKQLYTDLIKAAVLVVAIWVLLFLVFGLKMMKGSDMEPALQDGDVLLYYRLSSGYAQADPVLYETEGKLRVGRIAAGPGDEVLFAPDGQLIINGYYQTAFDGGDAYTLPAGFQAEPQMLSKGEYFILSEDKDSVEDSRSFGSIDKKDIKGKIITILRRRSI